MTIVQTHELTRKPLRLWPGVVAVVLQWLLWYVVPVIFPEGVLFGMIGGVVCALVLVLWWLFFSRALWSERIGALILMIVAILATKRIVHESIAGAGMGNLLYISAIPGLGLALVAWAMASRRFPQGARRASLVAAVVLACVPWTLLRTAGVIGGVGSEYHWRWTPTPEQRLLARGGDEPAPLPSAPKAAETPEQPVAAKASDEPTASMPAAAAAKTSGKQPPARPGDEPLDSARAKSAALPTAPSTPRTEPAPSTAIRTGADWPGFRGPGRDSIIRGVEIETDWSKSPPVALWRRPIGPGWSSFAVRGDLLYTQEQRGDDEVVTAYKVTTGEPVWRHRDAVRFYESNGGAGPRATPTLGGGRVYTFGATGILNALEAGNGSVVWSRNAGSDTGVKVPGWGFTSSPLVVDDVVIVAASGALIAYDRASGDRRWFRKSKGGSYSSPQMATIGGVAQVLLLNGAGATSVAPADGTDLWEHSWPGVPIVQPALTADGDVLMSTGGMTGGAGMRRIAVAHGPGGWTTEERWTSSGLKPYFKDFVVHKGHAFGFDGSILACIDLADGKRKWKGGRYGNGQLVLLPDQDLLLVLSEEGELALVGATSDQFTELARFPALNSKTWNHPVLVGDVLLVRNGEEMAAFRLSRHGSLTRLSP
jgi:outer membrane protein assembly factor BamB